MLRKNQPETQQKFVSTFRGARNGFNRVQTGPNHDDAFDEVRFGSAHVHDHRVYRVSRYNANSHCTLFAFRDEKKFCLWKEKFFDNCRKMNKRYNLLQGLFGKIIAISVIYTAATAELLLISYFMYDDTHS